MKLLSLEGRHPFEQNTEDYFFPINRFKSILIALLSPDKQNSHLFQRFKEFTEYLDVVYYTWKQLPLLTKTTANNNTIFALNYLDLIDAIPMTKDIQENRKLFCARQDGAKPHESFDYVHTRKSINKVWNCVMLWEMKEPIHKKVLIVLLERVLPHLEKPIQLTDFLMDSLDFGGPIGLLALQGVFTLIQKHNITYPNVYEKLYSMFEPEIFHTKFKARLFYLADIFLSSTHLPENLVAAFVKRLARLSLVAPPQDAVIILYFIGNMI
uniref:CCAAT-binding factor domain-containing protein n=1 Tax=Megaselia scalaris TaxID=36166 RepID=T1GMP5_MEGSC